MKIIEYFESSCKEHWLSEIGKSDWRAGQYLHKLLAEGKLSSYAGEGAKVLLLADIDEGASEAEAAEAAAPLAAFLVYGSRDEIDAPDLKPWIGFVYTFPFYRGQHLMGALIERACELARLDDCDTLYVSTEEVGLYEKYGFTYWKDMSNVWGEMTRVYRLSV